jgi:hypothetical protein
MDHGKLLSLFYLFNTPIQQACIEVGLVVPGGKKNGPGVRGTISAHRFRHTVGNPARRTRRQAAHHHEGPGPLCG